MTAAVMAQAPLTSEGLAFWKELIADCGRYTAAINGAISAQGFAPDNLLECSQERELQIYKSGPPSVSANLAIDFFSWGPVIRGKLTGRSKGSEFCLEEWEVPIARDLDGTVIGIFEEGRSFSPEDLARYIIQRFRCYYPAISLPFDC